MPLPATAGSACLHPESRWRAAPARRASSGGQDRSGCSRRASQRRLRGRFPRLLLRLPAKTEPAYGSFGAAYGADEPARELVLDADLRSFFDSVDHEWLLRMVAH